MPTVIKRFMEDGTYENILSIQRQLVFDYEEDISKYAEGMDKAKIENIYRHIPVFLAQENKKFQITKVAKNARNREYVGCADWLKDAGVVNLCHCLNDACLPLKGNYDMAKYKMYYHDTGLLIANLDEEASEDLRKNKNLGAYKGAIYENLIAQTLVAQGLDLFYYKKRKFPIGDGLLFANGGKPCSGRSKGKRRSDGIPKQFDFISVIFRHQIWNKACA